ncbi:MAG: hypothetical protein V4582_16265 [Pseudomonadota bacterium]
MPIIVCPKCAYARQPERDSHIHEGVCPSCGIAYQKFLDAQGGAAPPEEVLAIEEVLVIEEVLGWRERLLQVPAQVAPAEFWGRAIVWMGVLLWSWRIAGSGIDPASVGGFIHNINLPFHEFGHVLFRPFGRFMTILGGSLFEIVMPLGLLWVFLVRQKDSFAAGLMLWWSGENLVDVSVYIADAVLRALPMVGGGGEDGHDWGNLLTMTHQLHHTQAIARTSFALGVLLMLAGLAWAALVLRRQHRHLA